MSGALPFSISDILERVVPGAIILVVLNLTLFAPLAAATGAIVLDLANPVSWFAFLAIAYAVGVVLNTASGFWAIPNARSYWTREPRAPTPKERAIRVAVEAHFHVPADDQSWALCYGTCLKHGYGANIQLFLGLEVFCRAMMMAALAAAAIIAAKLFCNAVFTGDHAQSALEAAIGLLAVIALPLFRRGALNYGRAFVAANYEGFYSWYCEHRLGPGSGPKDGAA